jgi:hypothetical protein
VQGPVIPVDFHVLRRTWATHANSFGADLRSCQTVMRHATSSNFTTDVYVQPIMEKVLDAMYGVAEEVTKGLPDGDDYVIRVEGEAQALDVRPHVGITDGIGKRRETRRKAASAIGFLPHPTTRPN